MITYGQSINKALDEKLKIDKKVILLGEDIKEPYGGAFKITKELSKKHPNQVINTPMSEYALTGVITGMAIRGLKPVLEIMFGDFITICADQLINHATKFNWMYNNQVRVPIVIRTPMGGRRGYGPTHSQTIEKMYLGIPGLKVIAPSHFHDVGKLLINAIDDENPVLFIENKLLYPKKIVEIKDGYMDDFSAKITEDSYYSVILSNADFEECDVTILTYGGMLPYVIDASNEILEKEEITCEIIVPSYLNKANISETIKSIETSGRLVIVEEGTKTGGWGAEMTAKVIEQGFDLLEEPISRVAALDLPIANTKTLEDKILPQISDIKKAIMGVAEYNDT